MTTSPETIRIGEIEIRFHLAPDTTTGQPAVFESRIGPAAQVPPPHRHVGYDETIHGLEGVCHFTLEGREVAVGPGDTLFVSRGQVHSFINRSSKLARVLVVVTPGLLGPGYFREIAAIVGAGGPPNVARMTETMRRHGMEPVAAR
jgi:quercetin dioxygenase-like cupin family protein